jgi:hypothetical protein
VALWDKRGASVQGTALLEGSLTAVTVYMRIAKRKAESLVSYCM